ncbi:Hypothetical protein LUCI_4320 [Lucifera butyrica]|uniref:Uncharacterized protein n=1 Tax=Lucifera butyrica TaxID=1351585 RepID=A0A498RBZ5_9FIRM|nr:hypothetical protein [Lucifera butyrica]VBB09034.1 Hypothetical protein LUCI_4320 [Lucifera butyrica]
MNISQVARLLNEADVKTRCGPNLLEEIVGRREGYYRLEKRNEEWLYIFIDCEKREPGVEEIHKRFVNEYEAVMFYYFKKLSQKYRSQYVYPFEEQNKDIRIGWPDFNLANLKEAIKRLGIKENYYDFNNVKKEHSICLEEVSKNTSKVKFIGNGNNVILETLELENWDAYSAMFTRVYLLFLLDRYCKSLIKSKEIEKTFSDNEYSIFIK